MIATVLLALGALYASLWLQAEWHANAGWRSPNDEPRFMLVGQSATPEMALEHIRKARDLWPFEAQYRTGPALAASYRASSALVSPKRDEALPFVLTAIDELEAAIRIDPEARLLGQLISFYLDIGRKDQVNRLFPLFERVARNGPRVKQGEVK